MTDTEKQPELPAGWCWTTIKDIVYEVKGNVTPQENILYELYSVPAFENQKPEYLYGKDIGSNKRPVESEDVLLCKINPRINRVWIVKNNRNSLPQIASTEYLPLRTFSENIPYPQYLMWYFRSPDFREWIKVNVSGVTGSHTRAKTNNIISQYIPLPPLPEQHRIVQKIEELLTDLDAGVQALEKAKLQVRTYRQAVLKAAFEGKLSEEWREKNPGSESADTILNRITEIMKEKAQKEGKLKNKNKKPIEVNSQNLPELPKTWTWTSIEQISSFVTDGDHNPPKRTTDGIPHLTARNIIGYKITEENCTFISVHDFEKVRKRYDPHPGDIIVTCVGTIGRTAIVQDDYVFSADRNLAVIRLIDNEIDPKFVQFYLNNPQAQMYMKNASGSTAQPHLYLKHIRAFPIIFAPFEEQKVIVSEIERRFSVIDQIEKTIDQSLAQAEKLRQSILKKAFEGKLVPQNPEDEPSSVLLEKIRQEKAEIEARKKPAKTKSKAKAKPGNTKKAKQTKQTELV